MNGVGDPPLVSEVGPFHTPFLSRTKRSGLRLNDAGYSYYRERIRGDVTYWRCSNKTCKGRVVQRSGEVYRTKEHIHPPSDRSVGQSDTFLATLSVQTDASETMATMPSMTIQVDQKDTDPSTKNLTPEYVPPMIIWENEDEEHIDVKPDISELERSLVDSGSHETGVNTEPDELRRENTMLKMKVQRLEMELERYKDTVSRIKADLDILNRISV